MKENLSRRKLLEAGKTLFLKYGYRKVTVEEICTEAGISKMTFYRFFDNKISLVECMINELADEGIRVYRKIMDSDARFEEKIMATLQMKNEAASKFSEEFLRDIYADPAAGILTALKRLTEETMAMIMEDYSLAQANGQIRQDLNLAIIPYYTGKITTMVQDPELVKLCGGNMHDAIKELTNLFFYGILNPKEHPQNEK